MFTINNLGCAITSLPCHRWYIRFAWVSPAGALLSWRCRIKEAPLITGRVARRRPLFVLALLALLLGLGTVAPVYRASAEGFEEIVFRSDFESLPAGALSTTPVAVAVGTVLAAPAPVSLAAVTGLDGQALSVTGAGAAELRFSSYPGPLPQALNSQRYELRVRASLVAPAANAKGASLFLVTVGGQRFELVGFGADGKLARGGNPLDFSYTAGTRVRVDARVDLKNGTVTLDLTTGTGTLRLDGLGLPGSFTPDSVGALVFAAGGAPGAYGLDAVDVKVEKEELEDTPPPARIVITPPANNVAVVEVINNITIINFNIVIQNSGGRASGTTLILDLDDDLLEILDLSWVSGIGYIKQIKDGQIVIGIGQNNVVRKESFNLKFKFKLKQRKGDGELKLDIKYRLTYSDSGGRRATPPIVIIIVVPPPGVIPTALPATAAPTVTGTPPTATPTSTATPVPTSTRTPTPAVPTVTGTPPTATPSPAGPSPTATAGP